VDLGRAELDDDAVARGERIGTGVHQRVDEDVEAVEAGAMSSPRPRRLE
jgi:hypothetical protein